MCHVLIIEDEWLIASHLAYLAEQAGATSIATACTEDEAVTAARERMPAIILSDVILRTGTGPHAVQRIAVSWGRVPTIFITGTPEACEPCEPQNVVMTKPFDGACLIATFKALVRERLDPARKLGSSRLSATAH